MNPEAFSLCQPAELALPAALTGADGQVYPIDPDFRTVLLCLRRLSDPDRETPAKLLYLAHYFYRDNPPPEMAALFSAFVSGGGTQDVDEPPLMDFEQDAGALYASFRQQYGIDLLRQPLHWFEFRELLAGLTEQTAFGARVRLRMADENAAPPEERAHLRRLKEQVALRPRVGKAEQTLLRELDRRLAAGESPDTVLRQLTDREG